ncbi:MAG: hypothetical protein OEV42_14660 [Deltaproteobacteria bacterium]|nr:hypothetical protein [Deltaproteobacteria bacterium]
MGLERAAMLGRLTELKQEREALLLRIEGNCTAVRQGLNTALTPVDDLDVPVVGSQMKELEEAFMKKINVDSQIKRLEKELA